MPRKGATHSGPVRKHKKHSPHTGTAKQKVRFLEQMAKGRAPAVAAERIGIARGTAFMWKKEDPAFAADWKDAIEASLDRLETKVFDSGMKGSATNAQFVLRAKRREVYGDIDDRPKQTVVLNVALQEHYQRLERLGLPTPVIETDYEEDSNAPDTNTSKP